MTKTRPRAVDRRALDDLGILTAVIEAGSFAGAGEALGLTPSAVSRAVARLEHRIGVRVFQRTARSIALTDEGRRFHESIAPHLAAIRDATIAAGSSSHAVRGRLRVNVDGGIAQFVLGPHLHRLLDAHPELFVELAIRDRMGDLVRDGFDISVRFGVPEPSALKSRLLLRSRVITCASPAYLARHGAPRHPRDIERHRCVLMRDPTTGAPFGWELMRGKKSVVVAAAGQLMVNGHGPLFAACSAGHGIAQLIELFARQELASGALVQLLPDWSDETYPLYAYYHAAQPIAAKVRAFVDFVVGVTEQLAG